MNILFYFPSLAACSLYKLQQHSQKYHQLTIDSYPWPQNFIIEKRGKIGTNLVNRDATQSCHHIYVSTCLLRWKELMPFITPGRKERISSLNFNDSLMNSQHCRLWAKICPPDDIRVVRVTLAPHQWATTWRVKLL